MKVQEFNKLKKKEKPLKIKNMFANGLISLTNKQLDSLIKGDK